MTEIFLCTDESYLLRVGFLLDACKLLVKVMVVKRGRRMGVAQEGRLGQVRSGCCGTTIWRFGLLAQIISAHVLGQRSVRSLKDIMFLNIENR